MRPFGLEDARAERAIDPLDERLQEAWDAYAGISSIFASEKRLMIARDLLLPFSPSQTSLEHLILRVSPVNIANMQLGLFVTAGFSLLPDQEIVYALDTPNLSHVGFLLEKNLVVTGRLGDFVGEMMIGSLVNHGTLGYGAGEMMIGSLVNHGTLGDSAGDMMVGSLVNHGTAGDFTGSSMSGILINHCEMGHRSGHYMMGSFMNRGSLGVGAGTGMIGTFVNHGTSGDEAASDMIGTYMNHGVVGKNAGKLLFGYHEDHNNAHWKDFRGHPPFFLHDLTNPDGCEYEALRKELSDVYRRHP